MEFDNMCVRINASVKIKILKSIPVAFALKPVSFKMKVLGGGNLNSRINEASPPLLIIQVTRGPSDLW
jgi:hypothetical protein